MADTMTTQEVVTTGNNQVPQQVVRRTTVENNPGVAAEPAQTVYEKKKTIFRFNQIIWYIVGVIEVLLVFRFVLKIIGASAYAGFANLIYSLTQPLVGPFVGIVGGYANGASLIEWSTVIAAGVYICVAYGLVYLLDLVYPITPRDVEPL